MTTAQVAALLDRLQVLEARADITDCVYRLARAGDRLDRALMQSAFAPGATVDYGALFQGSAEDFIDFTFQFQRVDIPVHHMIGNVMVTMHGDASAIAESYELARHPMPPGVDGDMILASRLLDQMVRTDDGWRIERRLKVADWARTLTGGDGLYDRLPLAKGRRDATDASYVFGQSGRIAGQDA